jgi:phage tail sheath protein FI
MALVLKTPGVYIEEVPKFPPSVAQVETAIPAFIGYTEKAKDVKDDDLHLKPTRIVSLLEYETFFGFAEKETDINVTITEDVDGATPPNILSLSAEASFGATGQSKHNMYYSMQLYFGNGGGPCYIISVGKYTDTTFASTYNAVELQKGLETLAAVDEPTLIVFPEGQFVDSLGNYYTLQNNSLAQCESLKDRFSIIDVYDNSSASTNTNMTAFRSGLGANNLKYGAAYYPNLVTTLTYRYDKSAVDVVHNRTVNGAGASVIAHGTNKLDDSTLASTVYYSKCVDAIGKLKLSLPPSPAVVGVCATVDATRGVWKAPANVSLNYVQDLSDFVTDEENGGMNIDATGGKSVNAIRSFTGRGILIWGSRTLAGNDNEWRYVPVRRFFNMVEESVKKATVPFVFEPNDANTWTRVRAMISNYLTVLWRQGALAGAKPEHAFYVECGLGTTMSALDILEGRMIIEIGMAAVRPAEFIILRFSHKMQES